MSTDANPTTPDGLLDHDEVVEAIVLSSEEAPTGPLPAGVFRRLIGGLAVFASTILASYFVPGLEFAQPWKAGEDYVPYWNLIGRELMGQGARAAAADEAQARFEAMARDGGEASGGPDRAPDRSGEAFAGDGWPAYAPPEGGDPTPVARIEHPEHLDAFFDALGRTDIGLAKRVTRVGHWGDSVLGNDGITYELRQRMQLRFGDAGHGFHSLVKYDPSYKHQRIEFSEKGKWGSCYIIRKCRDEGRYGYGGTTAWAAGGPSSAFGTSDKGPVGQKISSFELWYMTQPNGGDFVIDVDGKEAARVSTAAADIADAWSKIELDDGPHQVRVRSGGGGRTRGYGVVLEREGPGVVWDGMALIGAFTGRLLLQDPEHWRTQLAHRDLDLVVFTFGGNDMGDGALKKLDAYEAKYAELIQRTRAADPDLACLVMAPLDHGERKGNRIVSRPIVAPMVEAQRRVAEANGCAFFDTFTAMGGEGSMGRWYRATPKLGNGDLAHPTRAGHRVIGEMLFAALMADYARWREAHAGESLGSVDPGDAP